MSSDVIMQDCLPASLPISHLHQLDEVRSLNSYIMFMACNLFYAYVFRHMKSYRLYQLTMKMIVEEMYASYLFWKWRMSWIWFDNKT